MLHYLVCWQKTIDKTPSLIEVYSCFARYCNRPSVYQNYKKIILEAKIFWNMNTFLLMFPISLSVYELCAIWPHYYRSEDNLYGQDNYFKTLCVFRDQQTIVLNLQLYFSNVLRTMFLCSMFLFKQNVPFKTSVKSLEN